MKRTLFILSLSALSLSYAHAAVGDKVTGNGIYVADGIVVSNFGSGYLQTSRTQSSRLYDSTKGAEWAVSSDGQKQDSNMCYLHAASNTIQYWQSYYGVFAKPQAGSYYDYNSGFVEYSSQKPLPYGRIEPEAPSSSDPSTDYVPDGRRLEVARDMYHTIPSTQQRPRNQGGYFGWATEWFFRGADKWPDVTGPIDLSVGNLFPNTGGYYANYFGGGTHFVENISYTTVFSEYRAAQPNATLGMSTATPFGNTDIQAVKDLLLQGFGVNDGVQTQSGLITCIGTNNSESGNGHVITCYGFTTNDNGSLKSILIADNNDKISYNSALEELFVKVQNERIELYKNPSFTKAYTPSGSGVNFIAAVSFINTPEVLQNMLAEYSDVSNEAQVWNGGSSVWNVQLGSTEELPTESTGWDVHVDGDNITAEHRGYYHTYSTEGRNVEFGEHADANNRTVTVTGTVHARNITVSAAGYEFKAGADAVIAGAGEGEKANLTITSGASLSSEVQLNLGDLTLENRAVLSSDKVIEVHGAFLVKLQEAATFGLARAAVTPEASVYADLDLRDATSITLNAEVNMNKHNLILSADTPITLSLNEVDGSIIFFTNMAQLSIVDGEVTTVVAEGANLTQYFSNITTADGRDLSGYQVIYSSGTLSMTLVPEPTTATLSILALAALATRRRRRK